MYEITFRPSSLCLFIAIRRVKSDTGLRSFPLYREESRLPDPSQFEIYSSLGFLPSQKALFLALAGRPFFSSRFIMSIVTTLTTPTGESATSSTLIVAGLRLTASGDPNSLIPFFDPRFRALPWLPGENEPLAGVAVAPELIFVTPRCRERALYTRVTDAPNLNVRFFPAGVEHKVLLLTY